MGFNLKLNDADIALALERAATFVREGQEGKLTELEKVPLFQRVFHGTHARGIEKEGFKLNKIGTGEGNQSFGWGLYFASRRELAEYYRQTVSLKQPLDVKSAMEKAFPDKSFSEKGISSIRQATVYPEDTARRIQNRTASLRDLDTQKLQGVIEALRKKDICKSPLADLLCGLHRPGVVVLMRVGHSAPPVNVSGHYIAPALKPLHLRGLSGSGIR